MFNSEEQNGRLSKRLEESCPICGRPREDFPMTRKNAMMCSENCEDEMEGEAWNENDLRSRSVEIQASIAELNTIDGSQYGQNVDVRNLGMAPNPEESK